MRIIYFSKDLLTLGLDIPFTANLIEELRTQGIQIKDDYLKEKELEEQLWNYSPKRRLYLSRRDAV